MIKPALTVLLALLCLLLVKANFDTFRVSPMGPETAVAPAKKNGQKKMSPLQPLNLNPILRSQVPDLNNGYLFNTERFLAKDARAIKTGKGFGNNIRVEDIVFSGAILGEGYKKALVSYSPGAKQEIRPSRVGAKAASTKRMETIQLNEGDQFGGYTVKEIAVDFILFVKGSDTIKKTLFDPDKERQLLSPRATSPPPTAQTSPGTVPPRRVAPPSVKRP